MDILHTTNTEGAGTVFAARAAAESVARLHAAARTARTWAELQQRLAPAEFAQILEGADRDEEDLAMDEPPVMPGYKDGTFPEWLQRSALSWFPRELAEWFRSLRDSVHEGEFLELPADRAEEIADAPRAARPDWQVNRSDLFLF